MGGTYAEYRVSKSDGDLHGSSGRVTYTPSRVMKDSKEDPGRDDSFCVC